MTLSMNKSLNSSLLGKRKIKIEEEHVAPNFSRIFKNLLGKEINVNSDTDDKIKRRKCEEIEHVDVQANESDKVPDVLIVFGLNEGDKDNNLKNYLEKNYGSVDFIDDSVPASGVYGKKIVFFRMKDVHVQDKVLQCPRHIIPIKGGNSKLCHLHLNDPANETRNAPQNKLLKNQLVIANITGNINNYTIREYFLNLAKTWNPECNVTVNRVNPYRASVLFTDTMVAIKIHDGYMDGALHKCSGTPLRIAYRVNRENGRGQEERHILSNVDMNRSLPANMWWSCPNQPQDTREQGFSYGGVNPFVSENQHPNFPFYRPYNTHFYPPYVRDYQPYSGDVYRPFFPNTY